MAIAFVTSNIDNHLGGGDATVPITVTGSQTLGIAHVSNQTNSTTGVTWNGVPMTQIQSGVSGGANRYMSMWYILNPTTGNVVASRSSGTNRISCIAAVYSGVKQSSQPDNSPAVTSSTGTTMTGTVTTVANNCLSVMSIIYAGGTPTAGANATQVNVITDADSVLYDSIGAGPITPAGTFSMTATQPSGTYGLIVASFAPATVTPISAYNFSSNSNDSIGGNNGTDTSISYVSGLIGNAASFTSSGSRISLGDPANLKFSKTHTLNAWINLGGTNRANLDQIFFKGNDGVDFGNIMLYWSNSNTVKYGINANRTTNTRVEISNTITVDSNWHMVTAKYTGSAMFLYWDGIQIATTTTSITIDTTNNWYIGNTNSTRSVNKTIDSAVMWDVALTDSEISKLYNSGRGNEYPFTDNLATSLAGYWKCDEASGNAADSVGSNTLTNNNTVSYSSAKINNGADTGSSNTNKWLNASSNLGLTTDGTGSITFSMWIYNKAWYAGADFNMALSLARLSQRRLWFGISNTGTTLSLLVTGSSTVVYSASYAFSLNTWYHVAVSIAGTAVRFYVNGTNVGTATIGSLGTQTAFDSFSLFRESGDTKYMSGILDEVGVWSRALSSTEIASLYNAGSGVQYPFSSASTAFLMMLSMIH